MPKISYPVIKIILGPTASGKSRLALEWARRQRAVRGITPQIINADAMQQYRPLRILTARPTEVEEAEFPHLLYGVYEPHQISTAAGWREAVLAILRRDPGIPTVIVGGTGLYVQALTEGLSPIPTVLPEFRRAAMARLAELGPVAFHGEIARFDPSAAGVIRPSDRQRMVRAWEVFHATRQPLSHWQALPRAGRPVGLDFEIEVVTLPRPILVERINRRVETMIATGAVDEVRRLMEFTAPLAPDLPMMKAIGVSSLLAHLRGELALSDAVAEIQQQTRSYAKRQMTWLRGVAGSLQTLS
ncbi:MAG: tRNA (adenosine(37)-N6)-dimethylallyltransferase MiaA [Alphaproteobacteria bacterium]|nr:tRNA (adenosine(37)-N6)-dimethylallyltransferase MiaA [Alphaproteobacteria bacterium]